MNSLVVVLALSVAAPAAKEPGKKDVTPPLIGTWQCDGFTAAGMAVPGADTLQLQFEFSADGKLVVSHRGKADPESKYTIDTKKDPAEIDFAMGGKQKLVQGIFKVEKDTLTICVEDGPDGKRPTKFESLAGTKLVIMTFKRIEAKKQ